MPFQVKQASAAVQPLPPVANDSGPSQTASSSPAAQFQPGPVSQTPEKLPAPPPVPPAVAPAGMTIDQLESMASANNPTLVQASARVRSFRGAMWQAGLYPNPRIAYRGDEMGDSNTAGFQGTNLAQEIVTRHKLGLAQDVISQQVNQAVQDYAAQEFRVQNDVKIRFYEVLLAQRAVEINQEMERISRVTAEAADDLFRANQVAQRCAASPRGGRYGSAAVGAGSQFLSIGVAAFGDCRRRAHDGTIAAFRRLACRHGGNHVGRCLESIGFGEPRTLRSASQSGCGSGER